MPPRGSKAKPRLQDNIDLSTFRSPKVKLTLTKNNNSEPFLVNDNAASPLINVCSTSNIRKNKVVRNQEVHVIEEDGQKFVGQNNHLEADDFVKTFKFAELDTSYLNQDLTLPLGKLLDTAGLDSKTVDKDSKSLSDTIRNKWKGKTYEQLSIIRAKEINKDKFDQPVPKAPSSLPYKSFSQLGISTKDGEKEIGTVIGKHNEKNIMSAMGDIAEANDGTKEEDAKGRSGNPISSRRGRKPKNVSTFVEPIRTAPLRRGRSSASKAATEALTNRSETATCNGNDAMEEPKESTGQVPNETSYFHPNPLHSKDNNGAVSIEEEIEKPKSNKRGRRKKADSNSDLVPPRDPISNSDVAEDDPKIKSSTRFKNGASKKAIEKSKEAAIDDNPQTISGRRKGSSSFMSLESQHTHIHEDRDDNRTNDGIVSIYINSDGAGKENCKQDEDSNSMHEFEALSQPTSQNVISESVAASQKNVGIDLQLKQSAFAPSTILTSLNNKDKILEEQKNDEGFRTEANIEIEKDVKKSRKRKAGGDDRVKIDEAPRCKELTMEKRLLELERDNKEFRETIAFERQKREILECEMNNLIQQVKSLLQTLL
uniref:Uncharacterized protein n=1 Tax=Polytomella parva TaxID=51329 RepID=A0A7S0YMW4_9CHLO|mmetsp:Transcript_33798/g.61023  ORF Transcript_33798/g.61023 Transcript_33798/m.61023 type:complete len:597 (+) Transcript_33798:52-1842(+)